MNQCLCHSVLFKGFAGVNRTKQNKNSKEKATPALQRMVEFMLALLKAKPGCLTEISLDF